MSALTVPFNPGMAAPIPVRSFPPYGMRLPDAALYVGISPSKFLEWVGQGVMPQPKRQDRVTVWLRPELEAALEELPGGSAGASETGWEDVA
jgi:hypothetical protein